MSVEIIQSPDSREKVIESLVLKGDLSGLTPAQRAAHYNRVCDSLGLNPDSQPFAYLKLNGKEVLYATRGATDQLAAIHRVNREIIDGPKVIDLAGTKIVYCVARAAHPNGRTETAIATLQFADPVNVLMKAETKAKRRATLSILGLGMLDEMEIETIPAAVQQPSVTVSVTTPTLPAPPTWATDLAACATLRDVRALYQGAASTERDNRAQCDDVRAWLAEHNIIATAAEVTAILATLPDAALVILDDVHADEEHETTSRIERVARRVARERSTWEAHSAETMAKIVARSYAHATGTDLKAAGAALKRAIENGDTDPEPPTGTDDPAREPGSDDGDDASAAAYEAHRAAKGERAQVTELRVVRDESSDPCVTSAAAWRDHLATHRNAWAVRGAFHKRAQAFTAEGVHAQREADALARITALGEPDARGLLHSTPRTKANRAA